MPVTIEHFPNHPAERQHCLVWTRSVDGERVISNCGTKEHCEKMLPQYQERAAKADTNGWKEM